LNPVGFAARSRPAKRRLDCPSRRPARASTNGRVGDRANAKRKLKKKDALAAKKRVPFAG
jgi:hypothetical protein